ncbi:MAG: glycosyltransferase family 4 protein [Candidatus Moranbacteria bacterium]|nr:glycosyltransferase family 4 protein [Candidatus Moranbacteria bacterium]
MTDKKKILLLTRPICPPWDEGSKNFAYTLAKHAGGFEIHLLTCVEKGDLAPNWGLSPQSNVICHDIYTSPKWNWPQKIRAYIFLLKEFFLKGGKDYDILHSFFTPTKLNVFALKLCLRNKNIKTIQTLATLRDDLYASEKIKEIIHADHIVTYSDYAKEKLEKMGFENIKRIYPGIDIEKYSPAPKNAELMKKYNTTENDFVINYTGEYVRLGDMDDVVETFVDLVSANKNLKLHLAVRVKNQKDAEKKREAAQRLENAGCLDRVAFMDDGSYEMQDIYNLADISIFPARTMAGKFDIPLAVIEAMACEKPVIASNLERLQYFLNDENSILIEPGDREALKEKILYLCNNPEARRELGQKGMQFVRENFDIMKVVKEYEDVYASLNKEQ